MTRRSVVLGVGSALPKRRVTNEELAQTVETSDQWIVERTGIRERRIAAKGEMASDLATAAARAALAHAGMEPRDLDMIVLATATPDQTFPATAATVQANLGMTQGAAFDLQAVCSGFLYALTTADSLLRTGQGSRALVIGAEVFSRILDWTDRSTCVLFGDGAGAFVLEAAEGSGTIADEGILASRLHSDGRYRDKLYVDGGPSSTGTVGTLRMEGSGKWEPLLDSRGAVFQTPNVSRDGRWIAYTSNETQQNEVYVQRFPELGQKIKVSQGGGIDPLWSPDGTRLYYRSGTTMMVVSMENGRPRGSPERLFEWVYYRASPGPRTYDIGKGTPLLAIKPDEGGRNPEIHVVLNWTEELKRLVPTR